MLWLDAFTANVDRSWRNPNLLCWHGQVWVIDHGACLYFHHGWGGGVGDPERFAAQPWSVEDHVLGFAVGGGSGDRRRSAGAGRRRRPRRGGGRGARRLAEPCRAPRTRRPCGRRTSPSCAPGSGRASGCRSGGRRDRPVAGRPAALPVRRAALRAARGPRGVRQRRGGPLLRGGRLPRRGLPRRRASGCSRWTRGSTSPRCARAWSSSTDVCAGDERAGAAGLGAPGARFGFLKAPRSTVLRPGPVHGGVTPDPARQLEHLLDQLVA